MQSDPPSKTAPRNAPSRTALWVASAALFFVFTLGITTLAQQALGQMRNLNTATSDNLQWTLAQTEVEYLTFYNTLLKLEAGKTAELPALRRWFDIVYSRTEVIKSGPIYSALVHEPKLDDNFAALDHFLKTNVALIDGPDAGLLAAVPTMSAEAAALRGKVRDISLEGIRMFSEISDNQRQSIASTLTRIAALTVVLILALLVAVLLLLRLYGRTNAQAEENRITRDRLQAMLNTSLDAVLVVDRAGRFIEFNGAASEIFGYRKDEALGSEMTALIMPQHLVAAHESGMQRHLRTGAQKVIGGGRIQVEARRKSGEIFPAELSVAKTASHEGEIFVSYMRDISERIEAEEKLTTARDEALAGERAKARFMAVMSHEMRTPLNGLLGSLDLLKATDLSPKQAQLAEMMQSSGQMLLHHVSDVLDISRLEGRAIGHEKAPMDLDRVIGEVIEGQIALARAKGITLVYRPEGGALGWVQGAEIGLRQVLLNLVNNAIKFTDRGEVVVSTAQQDGRLRIAVRDTGVGIPSADHARIFEDFVTLDSSFGRKADGTGLGLGIARRVVQAMGGQIGLESQPRIGSTFWLDLPYVRAAQPSGTRAAKLRSGRQSVGRLAAPKGAALEVLIVEDNQINRFILREMLMAEGHHISEAADGVMGVDLASRQAFDAIFMDISMPRLDGIAATVQLRAGTGPNAATPIIALTAHALPDDRALFLASGMTEVLTKPLDRSLMLRVLSNVLPRTKTGKARAAQKNAAPTRPQAVLAEGETALLSPAFSDLLATFGQAKLKGLLARYFAEGDALQMSLPADFSAANWTGAQAAIHAQSGSSATFGAKAMQQILAGMESDLKLGAPENARAALARLGQVWTATKAAMTKVLEVDS